MQEANPVGEFAKKLADSLSFDEIHQVCNAEIKLGSIGIPTNPKEGISILAKLDLMLDYYDMWKLLDSFGILLEKLIFKNGLIIL